MTHPSRQPDEAERLTALRRYDILDTLPEQAFDDLTLLAAHICNAPIAFIGFIDADRQWFKSKVGLTLPETPRYVSLCAHTIVEPDVCVIPDALADERFADNPLVTSEPYIRFYAAAQLVTPEGYAIGTISVIDHVPRELSAAQVEALRALARQVMAQLELRRRVEEKIRGSENQLAVAQRIAHLGSWEQDIATNKITWSNELYRIFGLQPQEVDASYEGFMERVHPEDKEAVIGVCEKARLLHKLTNYEYRIIRPNGEVRTLLGRGEVVTDDAGRAVKIYGTTEDITERKQAGRAIKLAPTLVAAGLAALAALTLLEAAQRLLMTFIGEVVSLSIPIIFGSVAAVGISYLALRRQEALYRLTLEQIKERERLDEALRESEEHFRLLVEGIKEYAIFMLDADGRIASWNEGATRLKGYLPEEIIGQHVSICFTPEDVAQGKPEQALKTAATAARYEAECQLVCKDGSRFWADVSITALRDEEGGLRGFAEITRDITEQKRAEEVLRESEESYRRLVELSPDGILVHVAGKIEYINPAGARLFGATSPQQLVGYPVLELVHPDFREMVTKRIRQTQEGKTAKLVEEKLLRLGGQVVDAEATASGIIYHGKSGTQVIVRDITERVRAREARMQLQLRLLDAQEEERRRLSRELHDQMGQHLPALILGLEALRQAGQSRPLDADRLQRLKELVQRMALDTHALARDLRPPVLDDFGLQVALSNYLEEWSERYGIGADFHSNGFQSDERLPPQVEITLFRTVQEALTNVSKHAQAAHVSLILKRSREGVRVIVEDDGKGFDVEAVRNESISQGRLGLLGMQERVELVGGTLEVESAPGAGTTIAIRIPKRPR